MDYSSSESNLVNCSLNDETNCVSAWEHFLQQQPVLDNCCWRHCNIALPVHGQPASGASIGVIPSTVHKIFGIQKLQSLGYCFICLALTTW